MGSARPLPGAHDLLSDLSSRGVPRAIATSGRRAAAEPTVALLGLDRRPVMVTRDEVRP
jgi:beta-phosphoglucomutase-like phosphatase (HAD superfamily)